jgi:uncharacterized protein (TIGR03083 family)
VGDREALRGQGCDAQGMTNSGYEPLDILTCVAGVRVEGDMLAAAAARAGLDAAVPACPGWQVRDLLKHTGYVHRWATGYVTERHTSRMGVSEKDVLGEGPADEALLDWFREGHASLVTALEDADPSLECWTFLAAPSPLAFWARRQAHETAIHRVDAEQARAGGTEAAPGGTEAAPSRTEAAADGTEAAAPAQDADGAEDPGGAVDAAGAAGAGGTEGAEGAEGGPAAVAQPFPPRFAADGVDELIMGFLARTAKRGNWQGQPGTLGLHARDAGVETDWLVVNGPDGLAVSRGTGPADCDVTGTASDLYLVLWNRLPPASLEVTGAQDLFTDFGQQLRITWDR